VAASEIGVSLMLPRDDDDDDDDDDDLSDTATRGMYLSLKAKRRRVGDFENASLTPTWQCSNRL